MFSVAIIFNLVLMIKGFLRSIKLGPNANIVGKKDLVLEQFRIKKPKPEDEEEGDNLLKSSQRNSEKRFLEDNFEKEESNRSRQ